MCISQCLLASMHSWAPLPSIIAAIQTLIYLVEVPYILSAEGCLSLAIIYIDSSEEVCSILHLTLQNFRINRFKLTQVSAHR